MIYNGILSITNSLFEHSYINYLKVDKSGKSVKEEKPQIQQKIEKEQDFTLDLNDFIKSNHYEKLSDSELIEKINTLKNEKLKINWIKQIKEGYKNDRINF